METVTILRRICLESCYLDQSIMDHLLHKLERTIVGECTKEYGHIIAVSKITRIINQEIGRINVENIFNLEFDALILNPKKGTEVVGTVCMLYKDGIFISILDRQKMLIPTTSLSGYTFDSASNTYKNGTRSIVVGDSIEAIITASQYNDGSFSCLGTLKELCSP